jgi:hypothetical protein
MIAFIPLLPRVMTSRLLLWISARLARLSLWITPEVGR